jgi:hypothetical protein
MLTFNAEELLENISDLEIIKKLPDRYLEDKVVLGIDIYKYSDYSSVPQVYVPVLFENLYNMTVANVTEFEPFIFSRYAGQLIDFRKKFISTGDGGFQIFDNPVEAIVFSIYFQLNVKRFNSGASKIDLLKKLQKIIGSIELRYAVTTDKLYSYHSNYYGASIINNSRILAKDHLNRMLIDDNTSAWLINNINSVENLIDLDKTGFLSTNYFKFYNKDLKTFLFERKGSFKSVDVLKIGAIKSKNTSLNIHNLHLQTVMRLVIEKHAYDIYVITLGNLNTKGIE